MSSDQPAQQPQPTINNNSEQLEVRVIEDTSGQDEDEDHWEDGGWGEDEVNCS